MFTTPAIRAIRRARPDARLAYVVEPQAAPVVAQSAHLDEVIVAERPRGVARLVGDLALARRLRGARFDIAIDFHGGPRSAWLTRASGAPMRIGYATAGRRWIYTHRIDRPRALRARHSVENQWDLLAPLGDEFRRRPDRARDPVNMTEDPLAAARVDRVLSAHGVMAGQTVIVVHVSAGNPFRRWPGEAFVDLVAALVAADRGRRVVLTSGPSEAEAAAAIGDAARRRADAARADAIICREPFTLSELHALIGRAALFVGGDSGPLHVAATTRTPIVGVFGPTLPARSAPWRDRSLVTESIEVDGLPCRPCNQRRCEPGDFRCLTRLPAERVLGAADRALGRAVPALASGFNDAASGFDDVASGFSRKADPHDDQHCD